MSDNFDNFKMLVRNNDKLVVEDGDMQWKVRGLNLHDLNHLIDVIPRKTLLKFLEGFEDKDIEEIEELIVDKTSSNFIDIYHSIIACGLDAAGEEEQVKFIREVTKVKIFKLVMQETLPKNNEEMKVVEESVKQLGVNDGKKLKTILKLFLQIIQTLIS